MRIRIPHLWSYVAGITFCFSLLMFGAIYGFRQLPHPGCVNVSSATLDLLSGRIFRGRRPATLVAAPRWYSTDFQQEASLEPSQPGSPDYTLVLWSAATRERIRVQDGIRWEVDSSDQTSRASWSPDNGRFAIVWEGTDEQVYLLVVNRDGSGARRAPVTLENGQPLDSAGAAIRGWSADGAYLALSFGLSDRANGIQYAIWSLVNMQRTTTPLDSRLVRHGAWSPQGARFAAISRETDRWLHLHIFSPGGDADGVTFPLPYRSGVSVLEWSPDGRYLALAIVQNSSGENRWNYDLYSSDGTPVRTSIAGEALMSTQVMPEALRAGWAEDGPSWVFLTDHQDAGARVIDLVALDASTSLQKVLASDLVAAFVDHLFFVPPDRAAGDPRQGPALPDMHRLMIPHWQDGQITVELVDLDKGSRLTLAEGADELAPQDDYPFKNVFWSWDGASITLIWASGQGSERRARLTLVNSDGTNLLTLDDGLQDIVALAPVSFREGWWGYLGERDGNYGLEIFNPRTGERYRLISDLDRHNGWQIRPFPNSDLLAVTIQGTREALENGGRLFLVTWNGEGSRELSAETLGSVVWSPDGSKLAYLRHNFQREHVLEIVDSDGTEIDHRVLTERFDSLPYLYAWTTCN